MRLWVLSDLHLNSIRDWDLPSGSERPQFDVLIVAGDLVPRMERGVSWLLGRITDNPVIYVPGNHEFYGCDIDRTVEKARKAADGTNVHILQNDALVIEDTLFLGATLWTDFALFGDPHLAMRYAAGRMNDYRKIRHRSYRDKLRPVDTLSHHLRSRRFIGRAIQETNAARRIVVTHHGCVPQATKIGSESDILSAAYTSDCTELLETVDVWIYGHTHETRDFRVGATRIVTNAKGYGPWSRGGTWENSQFDPCFVVEI